MGRTVVGVVIPKQQQPRGPLELGAKGVGAEVVGTEVVGAKVVGAEVVGAEFVGAEVSWLKNTNIYIYLKCVLIMY